MPSLGMRCGIFWDLALAGRRAVRDQLTAENESLKAQARGASRSRERIADVDAGAIRAMVYSHYPLTLKMK